MSLEFPKWNDISLSAVKNRHHFFPFWSIPMYAVSATSKFTPDLRYMPLHVFNSLFLTTDFRFIQNWTNYEKKVWTIMINNSTYINKRKSKHSHLRPLNIKKKRPRHITLKSRLHVLLYVEQITRELWLKLKYYTEKQPSIYYFLLVF